MSFFRIPDLTPLLLIRVTSFLLSLPENGEYEEFILVTPQSRHPIHILNAYWPPPSDLPTGPLHGVP